MNNGNEKLDQLLRQFMDETHARKLREELSFADKLFGKYLVPPVQTRAIDAITKRVHRKLYHRRCWATAKRCTAVAAVIIAALMAGLSLLYPAEPTPSPQIAGTSSRIVIASQDILWTDTPYAVVMETDPIEQELAELSESIQSDFSTDTYGPVNTIHLDLLEIEEIETLAENTSFWKG